MMRSRLAQPRIVVLYFACFALAWGFIAASFVGAPASELAPGALRDGRASATTLGLLLALAAHAALVAVLAWQTQRWFFAHGPLAVAIAGLPLPVLVGELWLVPAFFYLIAVLHVSLACRHESIGKLQVSHERSADSGSS